MAKKLKIKGTVSNLNANKALTNLRIEALDAKQNYTGLVGSAITNEKGEFTFNFDETYFEKLALDEKPELSFLVFDGDTLIDNIGDAVTWDPSKNEALNISVDIKPDIYEMLETPAFKKAEVIKLSSLGNTSAEDIKTKAPRLFNKLEKKRVHVLKTYLLDSFENSDYEIKEMIVNADLSSVTGHEEPLKDQLKNLITNIDVSDVIANAAVEKLESLEIPQLVTDSIRLDVPVFENPIFTDELRKASAYSLAEFSGISDDVVETLLKRGVHLGELGDNHFDDLETEGLISAAEKQKLGLDVELARWAGGNFKLVNAAGELINNKLNREINNLKDLAIFNRSDWADLLENEDIKIPGDHDKQEYAAFLAKQVEVLFPDEVVRAQFNTPEPESFTESINSIKPLFTNNENIFGNKTFSDLNVTGLNSREKKAVNLAYEEINTVVRRYPALNLEEVLNNKRTAASTKLKEVGRRINLVDELHGLNLETSLLNLDYSIDSTEFDNLEFGNISDIDKILLHDTFKISKRIYSVTNDAENTMKFIGGGYTSVMDVAGSIPGRIVIDTGIDLGDAERYLNEANSRIPALTSIFGSIIEPQPFRGGGRRPFGRGPTVVPIAVPTLPLETEPNLDSYIKRLISKTELFGDQNYCKCDHCSSILSPAAYFADLMGFIETKVLNHVFVSKMAIHPLNLKNRRSDLWSDLVLDCKNTHTLVPYLTIINEILENYISKHIDPDYKPADDAEGRSELESLVYEKLYGTEELQSFEQPFMLPLVELETYLSHFSLSRADLAEVVLKYTEKLADQDELLPQIILELSEKEFKIITTAIIDETVLTELYGFVFDFVKFDAQKLLLPTKVSRSELGELIQTRFIAGNTSITIVAEKKNNDSVQNDIEHIYGLTLQALDRMHRFVRLWKKTSWSIQELDLVLTYSGMTGEDIDLKVVSEILSIQKKTGQSVEITCSLFSDIPVNSVKENQEPLFDRLFNIEGLVKNHRWSADANLLDKAFQYPIPDNGLSTDENIDIHTRLLAGLGIDDQSLLKLLVALKVPLGATTDNKISINHANLSLLFRHVRLASSLRLSIDELFILIGFIDSDPSNNYVKDRPSLNVLLDFHQWWKESDYFLDELKTLKDGDLEKATEIVEEIIISIRENRQQIFSDLVFANINGISEEQSKAIIASNSSLFKQAKLNTYRVSDSQETVLIGQDIANELDLHPNDKVDLETRITSFKNIYAKPGAIELLNNSLVGISYKNQNNDELTLSREQSRLIIESKPNIFIPVIDKSLYWLASNFTQSSLITIPEDIPLSEELAIEQVQEYQAGWIIRSKLSAQLNVREEKLGALAELANVDFFVEDFTKIIRGDESNKQTLNDLVLKLDKLQILFKDKQFKAEALELIRALSGNNESIVPTTDFITFDIDKIKTVSLIKELLKKNNSDIKNLKNILLGFNVVTSKFKSIVFDDISDYLGVESGLVASINHSISLPGDDPRSLHIENRVIKALDKLALCIETASLLGVNGDALISAISPDYKQTAQAGDAIVSAFHTKYKADEVEEKLEPFEDKIRERKRDALTDYVIHSTTPAIRFFNKKDLYYWFLIDIELEGCARTSRLVAGISSLQLYVHRCLMNLEQSGDDATIRIKPEWINRDEWSWRKNYRVWEANRKVFLYPENYIEPELRDNKTDLFKELETELLQEEISESSVTDAYMKYISGLEDLAKLQYAGSYQDGEILHLFLVTRSDPIIHYYRRIEGLNNFDPNSSGSQGIHWNSLHKVELQIPVRNVSPIIYHNQLHLFWVEYATKPMNKMVDGTNQFSGYKHTMTLKFSFLRLDQTWSVPHLLKSDRQSSILAGTTVVTDDIVTIKEVVKQIEEFKDYYTTLSWGAFDTTSNFIEKKEVLTETFKYTYESKIEAFRGYVLTVVAEIQDYNKFTISKLKTHEIPDVELSLINRMKIKGKLHEALFGRIDNERTAIAGKLNKILKDTNKLEKSIVELIDQSSSISDAEKELNEKYYLNIIGIEVHKLLKPKYDTSDRIHVEAQDDYSLKGAQWDRVYPMLTNQGQDIIGLAAGFVYTTNPITYEINNIVDRHSSLLTTSIETKNRYADSSLMVHVFSNITQKNTKKIFKIDLVNQSSLIVDGAIVADSVVDTENQLFYHGEKNIQKEESKYKNFRKRIDTTVMEKISRELFEKGIDALLSAGYQQIQLEEKELSKDVVFGSSFNGSIDRSIFKESFSLYFREIFFFIPYLIANHLNTQGKYEEAQKWYHYIFNPTANSIAEPENTSSDIDRVWQYREFRNHTIKTLKEILTDDAAIKEYERDPFNPHAIARLRLGAYKKNIFMKYIDNLLDWGDQLFNQDTMESINEATLLYLVASDILGARPQELGDCNDGVEDTYGDILKKINAEKKKLRTPEDLKNDVNKSLEDFYGSYRGGRGFSSVSNSNHFLRSVTSTLNRATISNFSHTGSDIGLRFDTRDFVDGEFPAPEVPELPGSGGGFGGPDDGPDRPVIGGGSNGGVGGGFGPDDRPTSGEGVKHELYADSNGPAKRPLEIPGFGLNIMEQSKYFCVPHNKNLLTYWDRVEDRLFKIRNCQNISGIKRELPLFAPEIDPMLLVRARAAGLSLQDVLNNTNSELPPYRFSYLIVKAKEYASTLQGFGNALFSAIERKDTEELSRIRSQQQQNILTLTTRTREKDIDVAEAEIVSIIERQKSVTNQRDYYQALYDNGKNTWEHTEGALKHTGNLLMPAISTLTALASSTALIIRIGGMAMSTGGEEVTNATENQAELISNEINILNNLADSAGLEGRHQRTSDSWKQQYDQLNDNLEEVDKQLITAEIRKNLADRSLKIHKESIEQEKDVYDFYKEKYSGEGMDMYIWLCTTLQRLYKEMYDCTFSIAKLAERAYRFERGDDPVSHLEPNYFEPSKSGFLAADRMIVALGKMECRFLETNYRNMEVSQSFSLSQIDPVKLIELKQLGECEFTIPELALDLYYPGQYNRRIKSVSMTIPCITGPYNNVSATLRLVSSYVRVEPKTDKKYLLNVPPARTTTVATSSSQNDSGVFQLDFNDTRYMPFEGMGAVESTWKLSLPKEFRSFDYSTISDVVLHINYTADYDDGGENPLRVQVEGANGTLETALKDEENVLRRGFSLRHEFSNEFHKLLSSTEGETVEFSINDKHFPFFLQGKKIEIATAQISIQANESAFDEHDYHDDQKYTLGINIKANKEDKIENFVRNPEGYGFSMAADLPEALTTSFELSKGSFNFLVSVPDQGDFLDNSSNGVGIDGNKLKDIYLFIDYKIV